MTIEIPKTNPPAANSFVNLPVVTNWQDLQADAVIFGVPHGMPYLADQFPNDQSTAPAALRKASPRILLDGQSLDADFQRAVCLDDFTIVDGGDIPLRGENVQQHYDAAENAVRFAVQRGIMPISIGGDDGVTNPVIRGLDGLSDVTLIQIDAHLDWRDERYGIHDGYSSPMRRAAEQDLDAQDAARRQPEVVAVDGHVALGRRHERGRAPRHALVPVQGARGRGRAVAPRLLGGDRRGLVDRSRLDGALRRGLLIPKAPSQAPCSFC